jgi:hypothetical protein
MRMSKELADAETPFTDFRVVDCDGLPQAVFDSLQAGQSSLLSYFLYPDKAYAGALYLDAMRVSDKEAEWASYEDDFFTVTIRPEVVEIEAKAPVEQTGARVKVKLSLGETKFLLLKWRLECMRWEAGLNLGGDSDNTDSRSSERLRAP